MWSGPSWRSQPSHLRPTWFGARLISLLRVLRTIFCHHTYPTITQCTESIWIIRASKTLCIPF